MKCHVMCIYLLNSKVSFLISFKKIAQQYLVRFSEILYEQKYCISKGSSFNFQGGCLIPTTVSYLLQSPQIKPRPCIFFSGKNLIFLSFKNLNN